MREDIIGLHILNGECIYIIQNVNIVGDDGKDNWYGKYYTLSKLTVSATNTHPMVYTLDFSSVLNILTKIDDVRHIRWALVATKALVKRLKNDIVKIEEMLNVINECEEGEYDESNL